MPSTLPSLLADYVALPRWQVVWLMSLSLAIQEALGWTAIPICAVVAYGVLGIDAMSVEIENPFGHDTNDLRVPLLFTMMVTYPLADFYH